MQVPLSARSAVDTDGEVQRVLTKLDAAGAHMRLLRLLANSETGFRPFVLLTSGLLSSAHLPRRIQEIVILHLAARQGTRYEWEEHVPMAYEHGVEKELVASIEARQGAAGDGFTAEELLAVGFADDVLGGASVAGERWDAAAATWGDKGALDLLMTVGIWGALVPTVITALGLERAG